MSKSYHLEVPSKVQKELDVIPDQLFPKIDKQIRALSNNPHPFGTKKLDKNLYRIRVGDFRVIYTVFEKEEKVVVLRVARRNEKTYRGDL